MKKRGCLIIAITIFALAPCLAQELSISNYDGPMTLYGPLSEPFTFNGTCPKDVARITVDWYSPKEGVNPWDAGETLDPERWELRESYVLQKYVPGSGVFIYRIHPTLDNLAEGANFYQIIAERRDSTKLTVTLVVYYQAIQAERGGGDDEPVPYAGERGGDGEPSEPLEPPAAGRILSRPAISESGLQAGYADDNAQFNYFIKFMESYGTAASHVSIPVQERIILKVVDQGGRSVPNAKVTVSGGGAQLASGVTYADGSFLFFPSEHDLSITSFTAAVSALARTRTISFDRQGRREIEVSMQPSRPSYVSVPLDLLFILDSTGSMLEEIERVRATIDIINQSLSALTPKPKIRFGMVLYRDKEDTYVTQVIPFTANLSDFRKRLAAVTADGGGDDPEDLQTALKDAMTRMQWGLDGIRLAFVITDAPPHLDYNQEYTYARAVHDARTKGIKIFTVGAGGLNLHGELVLRQISQYTYAKYIFLTYGEWGESEGGAPGSVSHHTGTNFQNEKLEAIVIRFAKEEMSHLTNKPVQPEEDYFQAVSTTTETKAETLARLFDQAISQLVDYSSIAIPSQAPTGALPIVPQAGASAGDAEYFSELLAQSLSRNASFLALERKNLQPMLKELEIQASGMAEEKNAARIGKAIGAQMLLSSTLFDRGKNFEIFMKLVRVETGEILSVTKLVADKKLGL